MEYVDKMEVEWDAFTREMKQETNVGTRSRSIQFCIRFSLQISDKLEANDDIERDVERDIKEADELMYVNRNWQYPNFFFCFFSTRWQKIEEMHDIKDSRFKPAKERSKKPVQQPQHESDDDDDADLEKELQGMYNWRQKRSWISVVYIAEKFRFVIKIVRLLFLCLKYSIKPLY